MLDNSKSNQFFRIINLIILLYSGFSFELEWTAFERVGIH